MSTVSYRLLAAGDLPEIHRTFLAAFADYAIRKRVALGELERLMVRRGVWYELSVGAFDGGEMVAVMATGLGTWQGKKTAYDVFTGVTPPYRGQGIAGGLFEHCRPALARQGARQLLLEVIQDNEPAVKAYRRTGFEVTRELICFELPPQGRAALAASASRAASAPGAANASGAAEVEIHPFTLPDEGAFRDAWSWEPSWQNSLDSLERSLDEVLYFGAFEADGSGGGVMVGYAAVEPATGDLAQLAVVPSHRRRGIGTRLLAAAAAVVSGEATLRMINVDGEAHPDLAFYPARGAREFTRQYEMVMAL